LRGFCSGKKAIGNTPVMKVVPLEVPPQPQAPKPRLWYRAMGQIVRCIGLVFFRFKCQGAENLPLQGACLIASNHASFLDPPLIGCALRRREIHFVARKSLFDVWWLKPLISRLNAVPIDLGNADLTGVREALRLIKQGEALLVFPEGTRTHDGSLRKPLAGIGMFVARTGVPVLPVRIFGADKAWPRQRRFLRPAKITIAVGKPIRFELTAEESRSRQTYQAISEEIMRRIGQLQPPE
jgi:1-acyl-sn-glycerol-3-phosphate acyltransferase